ncbi:MAG: NYN domain-containing protein [Simkaniaceae bacterium]|nr:NYN domain-containing protein [Simkaniaceae bacterium]
MHYIIDGYNFLFAFNAQAVTNLTSDREELIHSLGILLNGLQASIVFDSSFPHADLYPSRIFQKNIEIIYAPEGQTADDYIIELITYKKNRSEIRVITSDSHLARHIRALSCYSQSIPLFVDFLIKRQRKLGKKGKPPVIPTSYEIERLTKIFEKKLEEPPNSEWLINPRKSAF